MTYFFIQGSGGGFAAFLEEGIPDTLPSPMGKAAIRGCGFSRIVKANTGYVEKKNNDGQSLPLEGKVASEASRIGY